MKSLNIQKVTTIPVTPCDPNTLFVLIGSNDRFTMYLSNATGTSIRVIYFSEENSFIKSIANLANIDITKDDLLTALDIKPFTSKSIHYGTIDINNPVLGLDINNKIQTSLLYTNTPNNLLKLNSSGLIDSVFLGSYVDEVIEYATLAELPLIGEKSKIYVVTENSETDFGDQYRWTGSKYIKLNKTPGTTDSLIEGTLNLYYKSSRVLQDSPIQTVAGIAPNASKDIDLAALKTALNIGTTVKNIGLLDTASTTTLNMSEADLYLLEYDYSTTTAYPVINLSNFSTPRQGKIIIKLNRAVDLDSPSSINITWNGSNIKYFEGGIVYPDIPTAGNSKFLMINFITDGANCFIAGTPYS